MDESDITTEPGIVDVKSGADGTSLDGQSLFRILTTALRRFRGEGSCGR
mgnify:CR=1 FL=1